MRRVAFVVLLASCGDADPRPECHGTCIRDPRDHCTEPYDCADDSDCPFGMACTTITLDAACVAPGERITRCRPAVGEHQRLILQQEFAVPAFNARIESAGAQTIVWDVPANGDHVSCAVFSCEPSFEQSGTALGDHQTLVAISNFDSCVLLHGVVRADAAGFELSLDQNDDIASALSDDDAACVGEVSPELEPVFQDLLVGCWLYDGTRVIRAGQLYRLDPLLYPQFGAPTLADCTGVEEDTACYSPERGRFGACRAGVCQPRCVTALDCERAEPSEGATECTWSCEVPPGQLLGTCQPLSASG